jgi:putative ABC transport system permease protein
MSMNQAQMILKEVFHSKAGVLSTLVALTVSVAVIVSVRTITVSARDEISDQMHTLGANMIILPKIAPLPGYYTADFGDEVIPENYIHRLTSSELAEKIHHVIPKLSSSYEIHGEKLILTGVLPKREHQARPKWRSGGLNLFMSEKDGDKEAHKKEKEEAPHQHQVPSMTPELSLEASRKSRERTSLEDIEKGEVFLGNESSRLLEKSKGDRLSIGPYDFEVVKVLEEIGSVDDLRVFVHLHQAQEMLGKGRVINAIELIGCGCKQDMLLLAGNIEKLLPGVKTRTITQIARTQAGTVRLIERFTFVILFVVLVVGWGLISNTMASNVLERHREIGVLMAIGASSRFIFLVFIKKAVALGFFGGLLGFFIGTMTATWIGPKLLDLNIEPRGEMLIWALLGTMILTVVFSWIPSVRATKSDPAALLMED